jgi:hypothetical protein
MPDAAPRFGAASSRWSVAELARFREALAKQESSERINWAEVVAHVGTRTKRQVYLRWLREQRSAPAPTPAERDASTTNYLGSTRRRQRRRHWSSVELTRLAEACELFRRADGLVDVQRVAAYVGTRSLRQVRDRLRVHLPRYPTLRDDASCVVEEVTATAANTSASLGPDVSKTFFCTRCTAAEWRALCEAQLWTSAAPPDCATCEPEPPLETLDPYGISLVTLLGAFYFYGVGMDAAKASDREYLYQLSAQGGARIDQSVEAWRQLEWFPAYLWELGYLGPGTWICFGPETASGDLAHGTSPDVVGIVREGGIVVPLPAGDAAECSPVPQYPWPSLQAFLAHGLVRWFSCNQSARTPVPRDELVPFVAAALRLDGLGVPASMWPLLHSRPIRANPMCRPVTQVPRKRTLYGASVSTLVKLGVLPSHGDCILACCGIYGSIRGSWIYGAPLGFQRQVRMGTSLAAFIQRAARWSRAVGLPGSDVLTLHGCSLPNAPLPAEQISAWNPIQTSAPSLPSGCFLKLAKAALQRANAPASSPMVTICLAVLLEELVKVQLEQSTPGSSLHSI